MSHPGIKPLIIVTRSIKIWLLSFLVCTYGILTLYSAFHTSMWLNSSSELANWAYLFVIILFPLIVTFVTAPGLVLKSNWAKYSYYTFAGYIIILYSFIFYLIGLNHLVRFFSQYTLVAWYAVLTLVITVIGLNIVKIYYANSSSDKIKYISKKTLWISLIFYVIILVSTYIIYIIYIISSLSIEPPDRNMEGIIQLKF